MIRLSTNPWRVCLPLLILLVFHPTLPALAEGFRILDQSAAATGQGGAFLAQADDPSALYFNPAGMTQLEGVQVSLGTLVLGGHVAFDSTLTGGTTHGDFGGTVVSPPPSNVYLTANLGHLGMSFLKDFTVGLGVNSPFGILVAYPQNSLVGQVTTSAALPLIDIKPTLAFRFNDYISIGLGLDIYTMTSLLGQGQAEQQRITGPEFGAPPLNALGIPTGAFLEVNGTDTAVGANVSLLVTPWRNGNGDPRLNLAFVYRSKATLNLRGDLLVNGRKAADALASLNLPQIVSAGMAVWPIRDTRHKWKLEVDLDYADWSSFKNLNLRLTNIQGTPASTTLPFARDYGSSYVIMAGTEFAWLRPALLPDWNIAIRGGYVFSDSPVPESKFEPNIPDSNYHGISAGLGFLCQKRGAFLGIIPCEGFGLKALGLDLAYQVLLYEPRTIRNNVDPRLNGRWETRIHVGAISIRMNF